MPELAAITIEGPRGIGKTTTALRRATTVFNLDDPLQLELLSADPGRLVREQHPVLVDEWQRLPSVWDAVRRIVDTGSEGARFLLTGSAVPTNPPAHSGAGRIVRLRMRPLSLAERNLPEAPTVSLSDLFSGSQLSVGGNCTLGLEDYCQEITASGFPGFRLLGDRARQLQLYSYIERLVSHDFLEQGHPVRRPVTLMSWLRAYAAASSTTASYNSIVDAATPHDANKPAKLTTAIYREVLSQLGLLDPVEAWIPGQDPFTRLGQAPKHQLADPALAARLLGLTRHSQLREPIPGTGAKEQGSLREQLFESLVTQSVKVYAQAIEARVFHFRTRNNEHEVDLIVEGNDHRVVGIEAKLSPSVTDRDVANLHRLKAKLGSRLVEMVFVSTGPYAYRRRDGVIVVPAALLSR